MNDPIGEALRRILDRLKRLETTVARQRLGYGTNTAYDNSGSGLISTTVQGAIDEHLADPTDAHDASAISFVPAGTIAATNVQAAIEEAASEATGIPATILDAKGDLIAATAADTAARLPVGADESDFISLASESTGLKWRKNTVTTTNPTTGDDSADGFRPGSRWLNLTGAEEFVCLDATVGAAVWASTTAVGSGTVPDGTDPGDLLVWDGAAWDVLPIGVDDEVLIADSGETLGTRWGSGGSASDVVQVSSGMGSVTIPGLKGSPDAVPGSPSSYDDEFEALSGWTTLGTLAVSNVTDFASNWHGQQSVLASRVDGIYKAAPSTPFTVTTKLTGFRFGDSYQCQGPMITATSPGALFTFVILYNAGAVQLWTFQWSNNTTIGTQTNVFNPTFLPGTLYMRMVVNSGTNVDVAHSFDGLFWRTDATGLASGLTPANAGLCVGRGLAQAAEVACDWIRFT
jgi:hypothetical protein